MNACTQNFIDYLDAKGVKYDVEDREDDCKVSVTYTMDNSTFTVSIFIDDSNNNVAVRCFSIVNVPDNAIKLQNALEACNKCNNDYRWIKFVLDGDRDVNAMCDGVITPDTAAAVIYELMVRTLNIVDECYPTLMKALWA